MLHRNTISNSYFLLAILFTLGCVAKGGRPKTVKDCGIVDVPRARIIGGSWAQHGDYPWMASVHEYYHGFDHVCGGTIINEHWILTAAHCIDYPTKPRKYEIYVGVDRLSKKDRKVAKKHKISKVIVHEEYDKETFLNDIALLRTKEPIDFKASRGYVNGICLPLNDKDPKGWGTVTGWGHTLEGGDNSDVLQEVKVPIVPRELCNEAYDDDPDDDIEENIFDTQLCAGAPNRDSCQNDSGGPLVQRNKKGVHTLIGVVSYGSGCGDRHYPGVYTKVASYMDWMFEKMKD